MAVGHDPPDGYGHRYGPELVPAWGSVLGGSPTDDYSTARRGHREDRQPRRVTRLTNAYARAVPAQRFHGQIAGVGSSSGVRVVVGSWHRTPLGSFGDAMVETADGHRVLVAPSREVAAFIEATYAFDEVRLEPITVTSGRTSWHVESPSLLLDLTVGGRMPLGRLLRAVPVARRVEPGLGDRRRPGRAGRAAGRPDARHGARGATGVLRRHRPARRDGPRRQLRRPAAGRARRRRPAVPVRLLVDAAPVPPSRAW